MRVLGESSQRLVANPALARDADRAPTPADPARLPSFAGWPPHGPHAWELANAGEATTKVVYRPRLVTDDKLALRIAALHGLGLVQLPTMMVRQDLIEGRLVDVLPGWRPKSAVVHVVFPSRRGLLPAVRQLVEFLREQFEQLASEEAELETSLPESLRSVMACGRLNLRSLGRSRHS